MQVLHTAGEVLALDCADRGLARLLTEGGAGEFRTGSAAGATVHLTVDPTDAPFPVAGLRLLARGLWGDGSVAVIEGACSSGFDLRVEPRHGVLRVHARYRPSGPVRAAGIAMRSRFHLLTREVLLQYPVLWWAGLQHGRYPLHASVCSSGDATLLIAGPSGIGKSTLVAGAIRRGERATTDNVCVSDGARAFGLVEPMRVDDGSGRRMPHGRRETELPGRVSSMVPDLLVVPRRVDRGQIRADDCSAEEATRVLTAGTYMAGELRRYWGFAALLSYALAAGPAEPRVGPTAAHLAGRLRCVRISLPPGASATALDQLTDLLERKVTSA